MVLRCIVLYCMEFYGIALRHYLALSCTILRSLGLSCAILRYPALSCTILRYLALPCIILHLRYTCSQQMSLVKKYNDKVIAAVAQKVKFQCCYIMADMLNLKKWGWCCWVSSKLRVASRCELRVYLS